MTCAAFVQMVGNYSFVIPVQELFIENVLAYLLPQRELGVADIVRIDNRGKVVWHITTMQ